MAPREELEALASDLEEVRALAAAAAVSHEAAALEAASEIEGLTSALETQAAQLLSRVEHFQRLHVEVQKEAEEWRNRCVRCKPAHQLPSSSLLLSSTVPQAMPLEPRLFTPNLRP
jgi:hypothetical protein